MGKWGPVSTTYSKGLQRLQAFGHEAGSSLACWEVSLLTGMEELLLEPSNSERWTREGQACAPFSHRAHQPRDWLCWAWTDRGSTPYRILWPGSYQTVPSPTAAGSVCPQELYPRTRGLHLAHTRGQGMPHPHPGVRMNSSTDSGRKDGWSRKPYCDNIKEGGKAKF